MTELYLVAIMALALLVEINMFFCFKKKADCRKIRKEE